LRIEIVEFGEPHSWLEAGEAMEFRQATVKKAALYGASLVFAAVVPTLVRSLLQRISPPAGDPEEGSSVESNPTSSR
jgi:hypothetical protein